MKTVNIIAADPMPKDCKQPEKVLIKIECEVSEYTRKFKDLKEVQKFFDMEATKLFYALVDSLPQGIIEPLVIKLLQHRVSLYHGVQS